MPEWEYCQVIWKVSRLSEADKRDLENHGFRGLIEVEQGQTIARLGYLKLLGSPQEPEQIVDLGKTISQLGRDGWELASHSQITAPTAEVFYFKREIQRI